MFPFVYDATLHTFFAGFVFSMLFAHGPVILPSVLGLRGNYYRPVLYLGSLLQSLGLAVRVGADVTDNIVWRLAGGIGQGVAILIFLGSLLLLIVQSLGRVKPKKRQLHKSRRRLIPMLLPYG